MADPTVVAPAASLPRPPPAAVIVRLSTDQGGGPPKRRRGRTGPRSQRQALEGVRVLVVEDEAVAAMDLVSALEEFGAEVCGTAASGSEASRKARELRPRLAVVDIRLKDGETGIDAAQAMVQLGVAIVFATAHTNRGLAARMAAVPRSTQLSKPYDAAQLLSAARRVLRGNERGD